MMADFLFLHRKHVWWKRIPRAVWWTAGIVGGLLVIVGVVALFFRQPALAVYREASSGKTSFFNAKTAIEKKDFTAASSAIEQAVAHFTSAQQSMQRLRLLQRLPILGGQLSAVGNLLTVGVQAGQAASGLVSVAEKVAAPILAPNANYASISREDKQSMLKTLAESEPEIQGARAEMDLAAYYLAKIPEKGLLGPIAGAVKSLREQIPPLQQTLDSLQPAARFAPAMLGYPAQRRYLFLLQNNTELRPTGGFIGTYGIVTMHGGEIIKFTTENVYVLDAPTEQSNTTVPPDSIVRYLKVNKWFFRDSNWSPDFPTAAQQALKFYHDEKPADPAFDGVIAVTPTFISHLLELTGPITVSGIKFDKDNLVETLQYQVEVAYAQQGISDANRKEIIGGLSQQLFTRLLTMPQDRWSTMWSILERDVAAKQVLMYASQTEEEQFITDLGWDGALKATDGDYLMVVDANLASLKSDPAVKHSIAYSVARDGNDLTAHLTITYNNTGQFNWKSTRYRSFVRVYVPKGSVLKTATGYMQDDKLHGGKPAQPTTEEDLGKTVFAGFIAIEPQEQGTLDLIYALPNGISTLFAGGSYTLLMQKQGGTQAYDLALDINATGKVQSYAPQQEATLRGTTVHDSTTLAEDRSFSVTFRP